jgi:hypothetical protein
MADLPTYRWLDPGWEEPTFISLKEQELVKILNKPISTFNVKDYVTRTHSVGNLLDWFNVVARNEFVIGVEELNT